MKPAPPSRPDGLTYSRTASAVSLRDQEDGHGPSFHGKCKEKRIPRLRVLTCQVHEAHDDFSLRVCSPHCRRPVELSGKLLDLFVENSLPPSWQRYRQKELYGGAGARSRFLVKDMPVAAAARLIGEHDTTPRQLLWHQLRSAGT